VVGRPWQAQPAQNRTLSRPDGSKRQPPKGRFTQVRRLADLARRARDAEFAIEELGGGTFTVSNLGAVAGTYSTAIINHPEVAILLVGHAAAAGGVRRADRAPLDAAAEPFV